MTRTMSISETGLRLIKAFEGFRPTDRELVTGTRVIGYGHRLLSDMPMQMSEDEAEDRLKVDLSNFETLVNDEVHAPLTQSQFDALVSLAFNIGADAFRGSATVRALNNGRVLDAANGFDVWRKATIGGDTYVVDALMRRRTAEKSLFLRTEQALPAPTALLAPHADPRAPLGPTDDRLPVFDADDAAGLVGDAPYDLSPNEGRRREDDPVGILTLSETIDAGIAEIATLATGDQAKDDQATDDPAGHSQTDDDVNSDGTDEPETDTKTKAETDTAETADDTESSPISDAADALGERLGKLLDDDDADRADKTGNWPDSLIRAEDAVPDTASGADDNGSNLLSFPAKRRVQAEPSTAVADRVQGGANDTDKTRKRDDNGRPVVIDDLAADDVLRASSDPNGPIFDPEGKSSGKAANYLDRQHSRPAKTGGGLWFLLILGSALLGASAYLIVRGTPPLLQGWGPIALVTAAITGGLMVLFALYAAARGRLS